MAIPNKGLGVRAKKLLPAGFRIIVEHAFTGPMDHPGELNHFYLIKTNLKLIFFHRNQRSGTKEGLNLREIPSELFWIV